MSIKYQVFISSTYTDLIEEREQVMKATLEMGHIPVGMEMFSAADEEQWKIITRQIDDCDYYAVIIAHRYGSTLHGISYTEKEYDYAVTKKIPVLGFIIENDAAWPADRVDTEQNSKESLKDFKAKVKKKPVSFWNSASDLHGKYSISLMKQITSTPRPGWIRATSVAGPEVIKEITRLSGENAELRKEIDELKISTNDEKNAEQSLIIRTMRKNLCSLSFRYKDGQDWEDKLDKSLYFLFYLLAPEVMIEQSTEKMSEYLGIIARPNKDRKADDFFPVPKNVVSHFISDFIALGLFEPSSKRHSVKDKNEYWTLTELGKEIYTKIRREKLEHFEDEEKVNIEEEKE